MRSKTDRVICGTCEYWTGNRNPVFDSKGNPKIDIFDEYGLCEHPFGCRGAITPQRSKLHKTQ